jgi:HSP20 family protein
MAAIMKWTPRETLPELFGRFDRDPDRLENMFFQSLLPWRSERFAMSRDVDFVPEVDLMDRDGDYVLVANLPGHKKEEVDVSVSSDGVVLKGCHREEQKKEEKGSYVYQERSVGCFERAFRLPGEIKVDEASAEMKEGVLTLHLPKTKAERVSRRIGVQEH